MYNGHIQKSISEGCLDISNACIIILAMKVQFIVDDIFNHTSLLETHPKFLPQTYQ